MLLPALRDELYLPPYTLLAVSHCQWHCHWQARGTSSQLQHHSASRQQVQTEGGEGREP